MARRAWSSHDGPTRCLNLNFQTLLTLLNLQNSPIIGGMGRFLDDGNYAKDIVEGTMFKVRQIRILGFVKLIYLVVVEFLVVICSFYILLIFAIA